VRLENSLNILIFRIRFMACAVFLLIRKQLLSQSVSPEEECSTENGSADFNSTKTTQQILVGEKVLNI